MATNNKKLKKDIEKIDKELKELKKFFGPFVDSKPKYRSLIEKKDKLRKRLK